MSKKISVIISRRKLRARVGNKTNPEIAESIEAVLKNSAWMKFGKLVSLPARNYSSVNLGEIDAKVAVGDTVFVPGKILSEGELTKKVRLCGFAISKLAKEKLKKSKSEFVTIIEEIKANPKAEGLKILK